MPINFTWLDSLEDIVVGFFKIHPLVGPMTLLFAEEAGFPLPIPGDVYISWVGYQILRGVVSYHVAFITLMIGILGGSTILYIISFYLGKRIVLKFGKFIHLNEGKLIFLEKKFRQYGPLLIVFGRHIPGLRIPITIFSGISKVKYTTFIISEAISIVFWIVIFLQVGIKLGRHTTTLFHNHYSFLLLLAIPVTLTIFTIIFGKFIPEAVEDEIDKVSKDE